MIHQITICNGKRFFHLQDEFQTLRLIEILVQLLGGKCIGEDQYEVDDCSFDQIIQEYPWLSREVLFFSITIGNDCFIWDDSSSIEFKAIWALSVFYADIPLTAFKFQENERNVLDAFLIASQTLGVYPKVIKIS